MLRRLIIKITRLINKSPCAFYKFHCVLENFCASQELLHLHLSLSHALPKLLPLFLIPPTLQQEMLHCFLSIATLAKSAISQFESVQVFVQATVPSS
jgi:hypothetical protein